MELTINGNINAKNAQTGETNVMTIIKEERKKILREEDWKELEQFLNKRFADLGKDEDSYMLVQNGLNYVKNRDERGFKGFLARNKENFFCNVLSNVASSGMMLLLSELV